MESLKAPVMCRMLPTFSDGEELKKCDPRKNQVGRSGSVPIVLTTEKKCSATLIGEKYLVLDVPQGATVLNKCINVQTHEKLVCKVSDCSKTGF